MSETVMLTQKSLCKLLPEVLRDLMHAKGVNINQLSKQTGLANTTIKRMISDPDCNPTLSSLELLAEYFEISLGDLLGQSSLGMVPLLSNAQLLVWPHVVFDQGPASQPYVKTDLNVHEQLFAVHAVGESLEPKFSEGTVLIFDSSRRPKNKQLAMIVDDKNQLTRVRQLLIDGPDIYLQSLNPLFNDGGLVRFNGGHQRVLGALVQAKFNYY